jgi:two-component sensor histidine kinase
MTTGEGAQKAKAQGGKTSLLGGLSFRLMLAMGLALSPLALLTYIQTVQTEKLAEGRARAAILGDTVTAIEPQIASILRAQSIAASLAAAMPVLRLDRQSCIDIMADLVAQYGGVYSLIAFTEMDRRINCASTGQTYDMRDIPNIDSWLLPDVPVMRVNRNGPISNQSILGFAHPVFDAAGQKLGIVTVSAPHEALNASRPIGAGSDAESLPFSLVTFGADGAPLTASGGLDGLDALLPLGRPLADFVDLPGQSFVAQTAGGEARAFAVVPLAPGSLYVMGSWPADRLDRDLLRLKVPAFVFPLLMWAASLLVAWLAAERQVIRHVKSLRESIVAFAGGNRKLRALRLEGAAVELLDVGEAYEKMTRAVLHDEAELENMLHQKEVLLREVHHRVKNNLQLIASILNMQLRSAQSTEAKDAMRRVQDRVLSLATVHRELYQTSGLTDVRADELFPQIIGHILRIGSAPGRRFDVDSQIDDLRLTPDQAVPLALFLTEGMANILKHAPRRPKYVTMVRLSLRRKEGGFVELTLSNPMIPDTPPGTERPITLLTSDGFGSQLLMAFARQLDGTLERGAEGGQYNLRLRFPLRALSSAEERTAPPEAEEATQDARPDDDAH